MEVVRVNRPDHGPSEVVLDDVFCLDRSTLLMIRLLESVSDIHKELMNLMW